MNGKYLLDTNIIIAIFANEAAVLENLARLEEVFLPSIAVGELYYGARNSGKVRDNLKRIDEFVENNIVIGCDLKTASKYGEIKHKLKLKGRPLPENDIWIAALALQNNLILVTRDAHFQEVENLQIVTW